MPKAAQSYIQLMNIDNMLVFLKDVLVPLAWPAVVMGGLLLFKSDIRGALKRIVKAGRAGIEMSPQGGDRQTETPESFSDDTFEKIDDEDKALKPWLAQLEQHLERNHEENSVDGIKRLAAISNRRAHGEYIFRLIFGSQLQAMERLISGPKSLDQLRDLYKQHYEEAGAHALPTAEAWMMFLLDTNLVQLVDGKFSLTDFGRSFYDLLIQSGFSVRSKVW